MTSPDSGASPAVALPDVCPLCHVATVPVAHAPPRTGRCTSCYVAWAFPRPEPAAADIEQQYEQEQYFRERGTADPAQRDDTSAGDLARRLRKRLGPEARIFEVGAATGWLIKALGDVGLEASGIDVSGWAARVAREELGVDVQMASVDVHDFPGSLDAVVALHVIEHLRDPSVLLKKARKALRLGGVLVLEVPDFEARMRVQMGLAWPYFIDGEHLQHFSEPSFRALLPRYGFEVEHVVRRGGFGLLQPAGRVTEGVAARFGNPRLPGWRGRLYASRRLVYKVPGGRTSAQWLNQRIGYNVLHRNAYLQVWARAV
jgi:SAM-dependent methyltransferase